MTEDRRQMADDGRQMSDDGRQMADDGRQMADVRCIRFWILVRRRFGGLDFGFWI
ncbi:MAG: hypothetical protein QNJ58_06360 [Desulfobacterales bacterium]|nr:hypothetical protein [Desulfobacterales bacterium]